MAKVEKPGEGFLQNPPTKSRPPAEDRRRHVADPPPPPPLRPLPRRPHPRLPPPQLRGLRQRRRREAASRAAAGRRGQPGGAGVGVVGLRELQHPQRRQRQPRRPARVRRAPRRRHPRAALHHRLRGRAAARAVLTGGARRYGRLHLPRPKQLRARVPPPARLILLHSVPFRSVPFPFCYDCGNVFRNLFDECAVVLKKLMILVPTV